MEEHEDPVVCRCEGVRRSDLRRAISAGGSLRDLKQRTRIGMGECQGRVCLPIAQPLAGSETLPAARPPLRPLCLGALEGPAQP